jgi:hypothetical protein
MANEMNVLLSFSYNVVTPMRHPVKQWFSLAVTW